MKVDLTLLKKGPIEVGDLVLYDNRKGFIVGHTMNSRVKLPNGDLSEQGRLFEKYLFLPIGSMFVSEVFSSLDEINEVCFLIIKGDELVLKIED